MEEFVGVSPKFFFDEGDKEKDSLRGFSSCIFVKSNELFKFDFNEVKFTTIYEFKEPFDNQIIHFKTYN